MAKDGYYGSPIWWCAKCRLSTPRRAEVPADEGTLRERLARKRHDERCTSWPCSGPMPEDFAHADELLALFSTEFKKARADQREADAKAAEEMARGIERGPDPRVWQDTVGPSYRILRDFAKALRAEGAT